MLPFFISANRFQAKEKVSIFEVPKYLVVKEFIKKRGGIFTLLVTGIFLLLPGIYFWISVLTVSLFGEIYLIKEYKHIPFLLHFLFAVVAPLVSVILIFIFENFLYSLDSAPRVLKKVTDVVVVIANLSLLVGLINFVLRLINEVSL